MTLQASAQHQLRQYIEQIERLEEEKRATVADISDKFLEAKAIGFDTKIMRKVLALRRKSKTERQEEDAILDTYLHALGMLDGTPMGDYLARKNGEEPPPTPAEAVTDMVATVVDEALATTPPEPEPEPMPKPAPSKKQRVKDAAKATADKYLPRQDGYETTISINGGPEHPISVVKAAVEMVRSARTKA